MSDMWKNLGTRKIKLNGESGVVKEREKSAEEVRKERSSYLKYNRNKKKLEETEIPEWDRQDFKR